MKGAVVQFAQKSKGKNVRFKERILVRFIVSQKTRIRRGMPAQRKKVRMLRHVHGRSGWSVFAGDKLSHQGDDAVQICVLVMFTHVMSHLTLHCHWRNILLIQKSKMQAEKHLA